MRPPRPLHKIGQSPWLGNITHGLLDNGALRRWFEDFSITGLTSSPNRFESALGSAMPRTSTSARRCRPEYPALIRRHRQPRETRA